MAVLTLLKSLYMWLSQFTRSDIAYVVSTGCQFMNDSHSHHLTCYIKVSMACRSNRILWCRLMTPWLLDIVCRRGNPILPFKKKKVIQYCTKSREGNGSGSGFEQVLDTAYVSGYISWNQRMRCYPSSRIFMKWLRSSLIEKWKCCILIMVENTFLKISSSTCLIIKSSHKHSVHIQQNRKIST